jgi:8-oxo-dGTP diphosphatase
MIDARTSPLVVSALIVSKSKPGQPTLFLNVRAYNKDKYGFPGGKLNDGESPEEAVFRETEEELGVRPTNVMHRQTFHSETPDGRAITMHVFTGEVSESIAPTNEIAELHWLTCKQMEDRKHLLTPITIEYVLPFIKTLCYEDVEATNV